MLFFFLSSFCRTYSAVFSIWSGRVREFATHTNEWNTQASRSFLLSPQPLEASITRTLSYNLIFSLLSLIMMSVRVRGQPSCRLIIQGPYLSVVSDSRSTPSVYFGLSADANDVNAEGKIKQVLRQQIRMSLTGSWPALWVRSACCSSLVQESCCCSIWATKTFQNDQFQVVLTEKLQCTQIGRWSRRELFKMDLWFLTLRPSNCADDL